MGDINERQLKKIAEVCTDYNRYKTYNVVQTNCQTFAIALCNKLELSLRFTGEMNRFVNQLVQNGESEFIFRDQIFRTRQQFDQYVMHAINFRSLDKDDQKLLLGYAHVFGEYRNLQPHEPNWQSSEEAQQFWTNLIESQRWER